MIVEYVADFIVSAPKQVRGGRDYIMVCFKEIWHM